MKYQFKPLFHLQAAHFAVFLPIPLFFDIVCLLAWCLERSFNLQYFITCVVLTLFPVVAFVFVRLLYPFRYVIDEKYITKYKGKKVMLRLEIRNVNALIVKKATWLDHFKFFLMLITRDNLSTSHITSVAFIFDQYEVLTDYNYKYPEFKRESLNNNIFPNCSEYVEILPFREIKKISKLLGVQLHIV